MDRVSHRTHASVPLDGPVLRVGQVHQTCLQYFLWEKDCITAYFLYYFLLLFGFVCLLALCLSWFAIHALKMMRI